MRRTGRATTFEYHLFAGRRKMAYEARVAPLASHGFVAIAADVTERKLAEAALRYRFQHALHLLRELQIAAITCDRDGTVTDWTTTAEQLFGIQLVEAVGRPLHGLPLHWNYPAIAEAMAQAAAEAKRVTLPVQKVVDAAGTPRFMDLTVEPLCGDDGVGFLLRAIDRTDELRRQRELAQAQKLEAIGHLAAGIAHEINSPMQFISDNHRFVGEALRELWPIIEAATRLAKADRLGEATGRYLDELRQQIAQVDVAFLLAEVPRALEQSLEGVGRVTSIVQAMKQFSHPDPGEKVQVDLHRVLESTIAISRHEWKYVADVRTDFDPAVPPVWAVPGELGQVFVNLIVNAAQAIEEVVSGRGGKGTITIRTRRDGDWVDIRVSDTGTGIKDEHRDKIFDPFFTTKPVGKGTGQGLAIARMVVVEKHGGHLTFETAPGQGTTFIVRLPIAGCQSPGLASDQGIGSPVVAQR